MKRRLPPPPGMIYPEDEVHRAVARLDALQAYIKRESARLSG
jgi:hypothetical protein